MIRISCRTSCRRIFAAWRHVFRNGWKALAKPGIQWHQPVARHGEYERKI
ncbi:MAG: hypothetical protein IAB93_05440 [Bacteroidetes bacterium]|uniref:Uncharacterized protein n=1 Tax=Candidatus Merdivivens pullistercoris TaxID=2840873 RepID=A0A9D9N9G3_9BACT|nr:hypothetical protein [Candidatus Merdivivens pullistercoris]